ncbi:ATP-dependent DNA helicase [Lacticaseibacillus nasuensis]|uniref:ATP-dependent DNA helicase n=1 Tax=Lacticaseibacillus nasuensis TaxID=944671 RepID=UPI0022480B02|nr:ATP-dependent DNA helicase [Lacticaseibacillus nasuensis]MCX2456527.1 ATP-dependent DNA helicase [Lacticaseibacillus nasuensis]
MADHRIGVREFVEFTVRTGDLNPITTNSNNTALIGAQIHRRLQSAYDDADEKEVYLHTQVMVNDTAFVIDGRADGVLAGKNGPIVEEIKTSARPWADLTQNTRDRYWAQARVYAHFLCMDRDLDAIDIDLVYVQTSNDQLTRFTEHQTAADLSLLFDDLIAEFGDWLRMRSDIVKARNASIAGLDFPFPAFRTGQRELAAAVYRTIANHTRLFAEAPTGTGKTISTLFPAIKAMGADLINRVFYLTAKQSTRHVAEAAMGLMELHGLVAKSITLTAKDTITFEEEPDDPTINPYMLGYYDRLKPALKDMLTHENQLTRGTIEQYARKHTLDPFEFSLDASLFCDVIICDYNYLFDPAVFLQRFFAEPDPENCFLVDEAHNLVSRARDMYSAELTDTLFTELKTALAPYKQHGVPAIKGGITKTLTAFDVVRAAVPTGQTEVFQPARLENLVAVLNGLAQTIHDWLTGELENRDQAVVDLVLPVYFAVNQFLRINDFYDDAFETKVALTPDTVTVKQLCLDPSSFIDDSLSLGGGAVLFSATLSPLDYYQEVLGGAANSLAYQLPSPFPTSNTAVLVATDVQTTYRQRQASLPTVIASLTAMVRAKAGHYLVFLPSYAYLDQVATAFTAANPDLACVMQTTNMDAEARSQFLDHFRESVEPVVGFAILGGIFSEGIDLTGDQLIGAAIVSVGLPGLNSETNRLRDYFDRKNGNGFAYAYQLPGFNHVLQAGGRVIRGAHDVGVILLLDARFATPRYAQLFPPHWAHAQVTRNPTELATRLTDFWEAHHEDSPDA